MGSIRVPLYCSHSYRLTDRDLNTHLWKLCYDAGFTFTVDPQSTTLSPTVLELMMARSAGFMAIVTHRKGVPVYKCSRFVMHEYGLAVQARKPRLVLRDKNVSPRYFAAAGTVDIEFDPENLLRSDDEIAEALTKFHAWTSVRMDSQRYRQGKVGIALPAGSRRDITVQLLNEAGDEALDLLPKEDDPFGLAFAADQCDYVIADLDDPKSLEVAGFLQGRATPLLKVAEHGSQGRQPPSRLLGSVPLQLEVAASDLVMYWSDDDDFERDLRGRISQLLTGRKEFFSFDEGHRYFRGLGRQTQQVFVSNAGSSNDLAGELIPALQLDNITSFHYQFNNTIGLGEKWADGLDEMVKTSKVFVMLLNRDYWRSPYCTREYEVAKRRAEQGQIAIVPFLLEGYQHDREVPTQGKDLRGLATEEQVRTVVEELDRFFVKAEQTSITTAKQGSSSVAGEMRADVAIVTMLDEEYQAVLDRLSNVQRIKPSDTYPNTHSWLAGDIKSPEFPVPYRVVVARSPQTTTAAALTVTNTFRAFEPFYVLVVGVAGGLRDTALGDVVIANRICAYEYGKIDHDGFQPRHDLDTAPDSALSSAAGTLESLEPLWFEEADILRSAKPKIRVGPVASGDKVVDDADDDFFKKVLASRPKAIAVEMEGAGIAAAIQNLREQLKGVGFGMIRGISDVPPSGGSRPAADKSESAQTEQRDKMKAQASAAAATCAAYLIRHAWPRPPRGASQS